MIQIASAVADYAGKSIRTRLIDTRIVAVLIRREVIQIASAVADHAGKSIRTRLICVITLSLCVEIKPLRVREIRPCLSWKRESNIRTSKAGDAMAHPGHLDVFHGMACPDPITPLFGVITSCDSLLVYFIHVSAIADGTALPTTVNSSADVRRVLDNSPDFRIAVLRILIRGG